MDDGTTTLCFTYIDIHILARVVEYVWCPRCCDHFIATGEHPVKPVFYKIKIKHFLSLHLVRLDLANTERGKLNFKELFYWLYNHTQTAADAE